MIPRIFVSSTIRDLQHVRDSIRELVMELGYSPVMSEHGEVGYLPGVAAADACFDEAASCDIGILIIGKRYGEPHQDGASVTHLEYRSLKQKGVPIISVVENDLLAYHRLFEANKEVQALSFPGLDLPAKTFGLISEIKASPKNNGISEFTHIDDARSYIRAQLAHLFGNLLRKHEEDPVKTEVRDILAEVRALRTELTEKTTADQTIQFLRVSRALLEDNRKHYNDFLTHLLGSAEAAAKAIIEFNNPEDIFEKRGFKVTLIENGDVLRRETESKRQESLIQRASWWSNSRTSMQIGGDAGGAGWALLSGREIWLTHSALALFQEDHAACREDMKG